VRVTCKPNFPIYVSTWMLGRFSALHVIGGVFELEATSRSCPFVSLAARDKTPKHSDLSCNVFKLFCHSHFRRKLYVQYTVISQLGFLKNVCWCKLALWSYSTWRVVEALHAIVFPVLLIISAFKVQFSNRKKLFCLRLWKETFRDPVFVNNFKIILF